MQIKIISTSKAKHRLMIVVHVTEGMRKRSFTRHLRLEKDEHGNRYMGWNLPHDKLIYWDL